MLRSIPCLRREYSPSAFGFQNNIFVAPVILIQDVHMNPEAQTNIATVLQSLIDQKQIGSVAIEGAFGPLLLKPFRDFSDKSILKTVSRSLPPTTPVSAVLPMSA